MPITSGQLAQLSAPLEVELHDLKMQKISIESLIKRREHEIDSLRRDEKAIDQVIAELGQQQE
jgi:hypothetical protein